jgi:virginiamycin B lyase
MIGTRIRLPVGDGDLAGVDFGGRGTPVLLVHGGGQNALSWTDVSAQLIPHGHPVAVDLRGHRQSPLDSSHPEQYWRVFDGVVLDDRATTASAQAQWNSPEMTGRLRMMSRYGWRTTADEMNAYIDSCAAQVADDWLSAGARPELVREVTRRTFVRVGQHWVRRPTVEEIGTVSVPDPAVGSNHNVPMTRPDELATAILHLFIRAPPRPLITPSDRSCMRRSASMPNPNDHRLISEVSVAGRGSGLYGLTTGPDAALWFTLVHSGHIARLDPGGEVTTHTLESAACGPSIITLGPDGALWFTRNRDHRIGRITTDGTSTSFATPTPDSGPFGIAPGPDGALWFTEMNTDIIGRITTGGAITEFALPVKGCFPSMISAGPDQGLWFTLNQANAIGRIGLDGTVTVHNLPTTGAGPVGITAGTDRAVWFVEIAAGQIGRIAPDGKIEEFPLPDRAAKPHAIVADPAGGCWFTEWAANRIGHVSPHGAFRHYDLPTPGSEPHGITVGPDRIVWSALETGMAARLAP